MNESTHITGGASLDMVLVLDVSGSLNDAEITKQTDFAKEFVQKFSVSKDEVY